MKPSLYPEINTVWLNNSSSVVMVQEIIEKGCLSFQCGEDGIQLNFSQLSELPQCSQPPVSQTYLCAACDILHSKPNTLSRDFIRNKSGGKDWRRSRQLLHIKLKGKLVENTRPCFPEVQTSGLKFRVLRTTNACIEFQYLRHHTERLSYMKIHQICHQYYVQMAETKPLHISNEDAFSASFLSLSY